MGCKISSSSDSSEEPEYDSASSEQSTLLSNGMANGYGIERLTDSPSPERKPILANGGGNNAAGVEAAKLSDQQHTVHADFLPNHREQKQARRNGIRTEVLRSSQGSSGSEGSSGRYTEPLPSRQSRHVASRDPGREWGGGRGGPRQQVNNVMNSRIGHPPYVNHTINKQNSLKFGGKVDADGIIHGRVPRDQSTAAAFGGNTTMTPRGKETMEELSKAYRWREQFEHPSSEFLALMDRLYMECQLHLTALSSRGDPDSRREADTIVNEMVALRNYWGPKLLPSSTCNAFVRERIPLTLGVDQRQFRIDCAQFFEPVPFYGNQQNSCPGELMKLYRFSVYNVSTNEVVLRYYLERSNVIQLYHVLCFTCENYRGQVRPYGMEPPSYWEVRQNMLEDVYSRLLNGLSPSKHPPPKSKPIYPANTMGTPTHLQVIPTANTT